jgi:hypothetical protein
MTVEELRYLLEDLDDDIEVRLAMQPSWPFAYSLSSESVLFVGDDGEKILYLAEQKQLDYLPSEISEQLGW